MNKQQIFDRIDRDIEISDDKYLPEHFDEVISCEAADDIFKGIEDELEASFGGNYDAIYDECILPAIERMYRRERLGEYLDYLRGEYVHEREVQRTHESLMPGLV